MNLAAVDFYPHFEPWGLAVGQGVSGSAQKPWDRMCRGSEVKGSLRGCHEPLDMGRLQVVVVAKGEVLGTRRLAGDLHVRGSDQA